MISFKASLIALGLCSLANAQENVMALRGKLITKRKPNLSKEQLTSLREKAKIYGWMNTVLFSPDMPLNLRRAIIKDDKVQFVSEEEFLSDSTKLKKGKKRLMPEGSI